jgi:hypothetical protein
MPLHNRIGVLLLYNILVMIISQDLNIMFYPLKLWSLFFKVSNNYHQFFIIYLIITLC